MLDGICSASLRAMTSHTCHVLGGNANQLQFVVVHDFETIDLENVKYKIEWAYLYEWYNNRKIAKIHISFSWNLLDGQNSD